MDRPMTTLFMLMSADGKISTGSTDELDFDRDLPQLPGVREGLHQYYELEQDSELWSLNTGRVMEKIGVNQLSDPSKLPVSFAIVDRRHLSAAGVAYLCAKLRKLVVITSNPAHPALAMHEDNLSVIYQEQPSLEQALYRLKYSHGCERLTVQSGGTLNSALLRAGLIDKIDVVVAPVIVGGKDTPTLVDGPSFTMTAELAGLRALELESCEALEDSYVRLRYKVRGPRDARS
ncbi:MAG: dihydrofolate reductase family protein [Coriobacteriales bacterium]|nr:dihydrofolate reductase family protein [Coriobacteriales bacterium]